MPPEETYAQVVESNRAALAQARLTDPAEHFPYKYDQVADLVEAGGPMGPGMPGGVEGDADDSRTVDDYMTQAIAEASRAYIEAQAAYLRDPDALEAYEAARDRLVAARLDHRQNREDGFTIGAAARRAG